MTVEEIQGETCREMVTLMKVTHEELVTDIGGVMTSDTYNNILAGCNLSVFSDFKPLIPRVSKKILDITANYTKSNRLFPPHSCIREAESHGRHLPYFYEGSSA